MRSIRGNGWAALTLAALVAGGCSSEPTDTSTAEPVPATASGGAPETPPAKAPETTPTPAVTPGEPASATVAPATTPAPADAPPPKVEGPATDPKTAAVKLTDDEIAEIKKLPAGEQALALKQAVCPVSGEHLGGMGAPIKVDLEGTTAYICCKGCLEDTKKDPKGVLAKLPK